MGVAPRDSHQKISPDYDGAEVPKLKNVIKTLKSQINSNKMFLYMVIHDLKHPCDSMIS